MNLWIDIVLYRFLVLLLIIKLIYKIKLILLNFVYDMYGFFLYIFGLF